LAFAPQPSVLRQWTRCRDLRLKASSCIRRVSHLPLAAKVSR
jgi:hypothetical protein